MIYHSNKFIPDPIEIVNLLLQHEWFSRPLTNIGTWLLTAKSVEDNFRSSLIKNYVCRELCL